MSSNQAKVPDASHPIEVVASTSHIIVRMGGHVVADSTRALILREASLPPVHYIPRDDVMMTQLSRGPSETYCPYKGVASYFDVTGATGAVHPAAAWSYEAPYAWLSEIAGHIAFIIGKTDSVDVSETTDARK